MNIESPVSVLFNVEDQQRICTFSKLNTRHRNLEEKLEGLKVSKCRIVKEDNEVTLPCIIASQQDKEALDDLTMELELADEDEPVMCVMFDSPIVDSSLIPLLLGIALEKHSCICH